jgi:spore cortex formation protein SpoVR/YcgB (stage V sporulation)
MSEKQSATETQKQYFIGLVTMMSMSAMQQLGKIKNPGTGKIETNLEAAQANIDMIDMLAAKTKGNVDEEETRLLKDTLSALKLNYVETAETQKNRAPEKADEKQQKQEKEEPAAQPDKEIPKAPAANNKDPKFHKSYE